MALVLPAAAELIYPKSALERLPILDLSVQLGHVFVLHPEQLAESQDDGVTWQRRKVPTEPRSFYFLDATNGWLVTAEGLFETHNAGVKWSRILKSKALLRCWFLSPQHGYAVGDHKTALETKDAGNTWQPLQAAASVASDPERTSFTWIEFYGSTGFISGFHEPKRPETDKAGRQWPQMGVLIQTIDSGETWKPTTSAVFGQLAQVHVARRDAALVLQFNHDFAWPSEIYRIDLRTRETTREYREGAKRVCSATILPSGSLAVLTTQEAREKSEYARPLELTIGKDRVPIDERLLAKQCFLGVDSLNLWIATDDGMIDRLPAP